MIQIAKNDSVEAPSFYELKTKEADLIIHSLDNSSTRRLWIARLLAEEIVKLTFPCVLRVDNWAVWESGCYMPLFNMCWQDATQSSGLAKDNHIIFFYDVSGQEIVKICNLTILAFLFAWDIIIYSNDMMYFALSHDDSLVVKGLPNAIERLS